MRSEAAFKLREAVTSLRNARIIVLDLSELRAIEGGGLGMLLFLQRMERTGRSQDAVGGSWVQGSGRHLRRRGFATICLPSRDLVLLDYHMLGMNGDVVAKHMKTGEPDVPIALLSADEGLSEGALPWVDAFVSKSESPANLLRIVEHLLDLRFLFAPLDGLAGGRGRRAA